MVAAGLSILCVQSRFCGGRRPVVRWAPSPRRHPPAGMATGFGTIRYSDIFWGSFRLYVVGPNGGIT